MKNIISKIFIAFIALFMWWDVVKIFLDPKQMLFPPDVVLLLEQGRSFISGIMRRFRVSHY
jgi:hypothetical protein